MRGTRTRSVLAMLLLVVACERRNMGLPTEPVHAAMPPANNERLQAAARGLALALGDSALRMQLLSDMTASTQADHALSLPRYFATESGGTLAARAASRLNITRDEFVELFTGLPELMFALASPIDRATWRGTDDIAVVASTLSPRELRRFLTIDGYDIRGAKFIVPLTHRAAKRVFSILPQAGRKARSVTSRDDRSQIHEPTISTLSEEFGTMMSTCDPTAKLCDGDVNGGSTTGPKVSVGANCSWEPSGYQAVTTDNDHDGDGIKDECEFVFAKTFEPQLVFHAEEIHGHREPYYTVRRGPSGLEIMYLLSYYHDGGSHSHHGDSEFIVVHLWPGTVLGEHKFAVKNVFTTAHWGLCCGYDDSRWWAYYEFTYVTGRPHVYVSKNHHANWPTHQRCNEHIGDHCNSIPMGFVERLKVDFIPNNNIGHVGREWDIDPGLGGNPDCTRAKWDTSRLGIECYLSDGDGSDFAGWANEAGTAHYIDKIVGMGFAYP